MDKAGIDPNAKDEDEDDEDANPESPDDGSYCLFNRFLPSPQSSPFLGSES